MGKKRIIQENIQGLVIFNHKKGSWLNKADRYTVEKNNLKDKVKFVNNFGPQTNRYIYRINLMNESSFPIYEVNIKVIFPKFLNYLGSFPLTLNVQSSIEKDKGKINFLEIIIGELKEKSSKEIRLQYTPYLLPSTGEIRTIITYINNEGKSRILTSNPIEIQFDKIILTPKIIPNSQIGEFTQLKRTSRDLISFGIRMTKKMNLNKFFDIIESLFKVQNLQLITKDEEMGIIWFFGTDIQSDTDILTLCKIGSNQFEIIAYSKNPFIHASFLFLLTKILKEHISMKKTLKSKISIFELVCINCGAILLYFPRKGEYITCTKCNYEQIVW